MRGTRFAGLVALLFAALFHAILLLAAPPAAAQAAARAAQHNSAYRRSCFHASFERRVNGGESFSRPLGGGLVFHLRPQPENQGWRIVVSPQGSADDWAYPVNPPLRSANAQAMSSGWGKSVRQRLQVPHRVRFLYRKAGYERMSRLVNDALWPYSAKDPDHATEAYFEGLHTVRTGMVEVTALDFDQSGAPEIVKWMRFRAVVTVPRDFAGDPRLGWKAGACPPAPSY